MGRAARLELHLGWNGNAAREGPSFGSSNPDSRTLECLRGEMHFVLMSTLAMPRFFPATALFGVTASGVTLVAARGQRDE